MRVFDVYSHPVEGYQAVKQGFSWPALFFTFIWAFVKKMAALGFIVLAVMLAMYGLERYVDSLEGTESGVEAISGASNYSGIKVIQIVVGLGNLAVAIFIGFKGNNWRRKNLTGRGFTFVKAVLAASPNVAIASASADSTGSDTRPER